MYKVYVPIYIDNNIEDWDKTLREIKRTDASEVMMGIERRLPAPFSSEKSLSKLSRAIEFFEKAGYTVTVWLGESIGHGGPVGDYYQNIEGIGGEAVNGICPLDENFRKDMASWAVSIIRHGGKKLMLDDDIRLGYRNDKGCLCPLHVKKISEILGEKVTADEIRKKAFTGGRNKYRDAFLKANGDSLLGVLRTMRAEIDKADPTVRLGFCCGPNMWDNDGVDAITAAKTAAGNTKPFFRLCGAPYWVAQWKDKTLGEIIETERTQCAFVRGNDIEFFAEGDTYPRPRYETPASHLTAFDLVMRASGEVGGMLSYLLDYVSDGDYETGYTEDYNAFIEKREYIEKVMAPKTAVGVNLCNFREITADTDFTYTKNNSYPDSNLIYPSCRFATEHSLPITHSGKGVNILFGENARHIEEEKLASGNIIDFTAARILSERGIDVGIEEFSDEKLSGCTECTDMKGGKFRFSDSYYKMAGNGEKYKPRENAEIISDIYGFPGMFTYKNEKGQSFFVIPYDMDINKDIWGMTFTYDFRDALVDYISSTGNELMAVPVGKHPHLYSMVKTDGERTVIGLWNLSQDRIYNLPIKIKAPHKATAFRFCKGRKTKEGAVITTTLQPFDFCAVEIK